MQILGYAIPGNGLVEVFGSRKIAAGLRIEAAVAGERARDLADAVGAKVEADAGIFVANGGQRLALVVYADKGHDEFVSDILVVEILHSLHRVNVFAALTVAVNHRIESLGNALPAAIAIHGVVAAVDRGDLAGVVLAHFLLQLLEIAGAVGGQGVAPVHKGVHVDTVDTLVASPSSAARKDGSAGSARRHRRAGQTDASRRPPVRACFMAVISVGSEKKSPF